MPDVTTNEPKKAITKKCKYCQTEIPMSAKVCPNCRKKQGGGKGKWIVIGIIAIFIIGAAASNGAKETNNNSVPKDSYVTDLDNTENDNKTSVPTEYKSALKKANIYSKDMHMSRQGVYDQLVSEYGEKFSTEAAQYAIDNVVADWNANALKKAQDYQSQMSMSSSAIYDQLISEYGEKFTADEAQYAIENLK